MKLDVDVFGLIHGKAGLVRYPDGRAITFLGSVNESATVWKLNYELLWEDDSPEAVAWVAEEFESLWHDSKAVDFACCPFVEADLKRLAQRKVIAVDSWLEAPDPSSVAVESPVYRKEQGLWPHQVGRSDHGTVLLAGTEVHHPTQRRFREGLFIMPTMTSTDEIADLLWVGQAAAGVAGSGASGAPPRAKGTLWASNSFQSKVYRADSAAAEFTQVYDDGRDFGSAESLAALPDGSLRFVRDGQVMRLQQGASPSSWTAEPDREASALVHAAWQALAGAYPLALAWNEAGGISALSELWLLASDPQAGIRTEAAGKNALYLQAGYVVNPVHRARNFAILEEKGLNALVIDLKDDYGRLRYAPLDPLVKSLGRRSNPMDIETVAREAKDRGVWLVARIPVFKDEALTKALGGKYAVWDSVNKMAWQGWRTEKKEATQPVAPSIPPSFGPPGSQFQNPPPLQSATPPAAAQPATERVLYGKRWVDPYSEEVWAYNVAIANEIIARGFDEVQFDYIRFPTDGENLGDASYRWRDPGMDKESAIASFLAFARERIQAPISIDIYGANGWYRSGARTGQDVELIARYVDIICPMLYPSHFEQGFLGQAPAVERPLRIYRLGSLRNARIARDRVIVRPYVQAFYMNVSYDRAFYNADYVTREVQGVLEGQNLGMTFWNNVDRYDEVPYFSRSPSGALVVRSASASPATPASASASIAETVPLSPAGLAPLAPAEASIDESLLN